MNDIYDTEHAFTIGELRKASKDDCNRNGDGFDFNTHYKQNSDIFKKNFIKILDIFVDNICNKKIEQIQNIYSPVSPINNNSNNDIHKSKISDFLEQKTISNLLNFNSKDYDLDDYNSMPQNPKQYYIKIQKPNSSTAKISKYPEKEADLKRSIYLRNKLMKNSK